MQLIKIASDRVQIKSNQDQLGPIRINDAMLAEDADSGVSLVCMVTAITRNEEPERFDLDGELLEPDVTSTIDCSIIGSLAGGRFTKSVDVYPTTNVAIRPISTALFAAMVSGDTHAAFRLGRYAGYDCEAYLDGNRLFQRHSAILGNTGSGKSFTVASILEKVSQLQSANVVVFDIHGEYADLSYVKKIRIGEGGLDFPMWFLSFKDLYGSILRIKEETSTIQLAALRKAFYQARQSDKNEELPLPFSLEEIVSILETEDTAEMETGEVYKSGARAGQPKTVKGESFGKLTSVVNLLRDKQMDRRYAFMTHNQPADYLELFLSQVLGTSEKQIKVIDLSGIPSDMVPTIIAVTTKLLYRIQLMQERKEILPLNIVCDEAHAYIPTSDFGLGASQRRLLEIFETIAKEGRKFGVSLMVISQRPSELNRTIMAQCANYIILKMSNDADKQMVKGILPDGSKGIIDSVNLFKPGDCLVVGDSADITFKVNMDLPSEAPNSNTIDTWDEWNQERSPDVAGLVAKLLDEK